VKYEKERKEEKKVTRKSLTSAYFAFSAFCEGPLGKLAEVLIFTCRSNNVFQGNGKYFPIKGDFFSIVFSFSLYQSEFTCSYSYPGRPA